jgi:hypothetical protein
MRNGPQGGTIVVVARFEPDCAARKRGEQLMSITLEPLAKVDINNILDILRPEITMQSNWAILRVQFSDDKDTDWPPASKYDDLFTSAGSGKMGLVDFFSDMSHGQLDLSGSKVFGPYKIPYKRSDYVGRWVPNPPAGKVNADGLFSVAKSFATNAGVNLNDYAGVIATFIGHVDLFGWIGGMAAFCDSFSLDVSGLPQEIGHGYGLNHSRALGSVQDYNDPWDVMSTYNAHMAPNKEFTLVGPGLNAWNMRSRGWLDETRVYIATTIDTIVTLRPLHRRDLPGYLAAQVGEYLVEFRVPQRWDAAIPRACVLVHSFWDNHSYLVTSQNGNQDFVKGDKFIFIRPEYQFSGSVEVISIDVPNLTATVRLTQEHTLPPNPVTVGQILGGVAIDAGGVIVVGGKVIPVPPRGPELGLLQGVARYLDVTISANNVQAALADRRAGLQAIVRTAIDLHKQAMPTSETPPGYPASISPPPKKKSPPADIDE